MSPAARCAAAAGASVLRGRAAGSARKRGAKAARLACARRQADTSGTWKAAGSRFQDAITETRWATLLTRERESRGALLQRTTAATTFASEFPALPPGWDYAIVRFRTSFAKQPRSSEDITLERGPDSVWRVIGYVIR
jgi:hypothetical protein